MRFPLAWTIYTALCTFVHSIVDIGTHICVYWYRMFCTFNLRRADKNVSAYIIIGITPHRVHSARDETEMSHFNTPKSRKNVVFLCRLENFIYLCTINVKAKASSRQWLTYWERKKGLKCSMKWSIWMFLRENSKKNQIFLWIREISMLLCSLKCALAGGVRVYYIRYSGNKANKNSINN